MKTPKPVVIRYSEGCETADTYMDTPNGLVYLGSFHTIEDAVGFYPYNRKVAELWDAPIADIRDASSLLVFPDHPGEDAQPC